MSSVDIGGDERTANNTVRHKYRILSDAEKAQIEEFEDMSLAFIEKLHLIGGTDPVIGCMASRDLSLAQTHAVDPVMRAVRHITA
jgi:hypothetical protein